MAIWEDPNRVRNISDARMNAKVWDKLDHWTTQAGDPFRLLTTIFRPQVGQSTKLQHWCNSCSPFRRIPSTWEKTLSVVK